MDVQELAKVYEIKSDEELLLLASDLQELTPEARSVLSGELARRQIDIREHLGPARQEEEERTVEIDRNLNQPAPERRTSASWQVLWFAVHLLFVYAVVTLATPRIAYWTRDVIVPLLWTGNTSSRFEFFFSHLLAFSFTPALIGGFINARFKHKAAKFVWLVPTAILAYKLVSFPTATSVLQTHSLSAFHQYFGSGFHVPDFHDWHEFWTVVVPTPDYRRGMTQVSFTAPFYAAVGYSLAAWIAGRTRLSEAVSPRIMQWEKRKFQRP